MEQFEWIVLLRHWAEWLAAAGTPATTTYLRLYHLRRFSGTFPDPCVSTQQMAAWLGSHDWSPETIRSFRASLRSFYKWMVATAQIDQDPTAGLPTIRPVQHFARPAPEEVVNDGLAFADERVTMMLILADRQGMRRGEIARCHTDDLHRDLFGWSLVVHGKGNKDRVIPCLDDVATMIRLRPPGFLFPGNDHGHLSPPYVGKLMSRALRDKWTAHTLRHRFGTRIYANTKDLLATQQLMGHSKPETTLNYVRLPDEAMRAAIATIA